MSELNPVVIVGGDNLQDRPAMIFDDFDLKLDLGGVVNDVDGRS